MDFLLVAFPWIFYMKPTFNCWFSLCIQFFFSSTVLLLQHTAFPSTQYTSPAPFYSVYFGSFFFFLLSFFLFSHSCLSVYRVCNIDTYCCFVAIEIGDIFFFWLLSLTNQFSKLKSFMEFFMKGQKMKRNSSSEWMKLTWMNICFSYWSWRGIFFGNFDDFFRLCVWFKFGFALSRTFI